MTMKKIQEMTDEEILNCVATAIHDYLMKIRPHGEFNLDRCMWMQSNELRRLYRMGLGLGMRDSMSAKDARELNRLICRLEPGMKQQAQAIQLHYNKEQTLWKIRSTASKARIEKAFGDAGLRTYVDAQCYRARVVAEVGSYKVRLYVGYKALEQENTLDDVVHAVLDLRDALYRLGNDVKVGR